MTDAEGTPPTPPNDPFGTPPTPPPPVPPVPPAPQFPPAAPMPPTPPQAPGFGTPPGYGAPPAGQGGVPPFGAAPGYGATPGYYGAPPQTAGKAVAVMVLGIVSLVMVCAYGIGLITAIVALALAPGAKREINASGGRLTGLGMVKAGVICSWISVGLGIAGLLFFIVAIVLGAAADSSFDSTYVISSVLS